MGSSGGGNYAAPNIPAPPASMISPQGSTAPFNPAYASFLPSDPNAMATGLTPEMLAAIMSQPAAAPPVFAGAPPGMPAPAPAAGVGPNPAWGGMSNANSSRPTRGGMPGYGATPNLAGVTVPMNPATDAERQRLTQLMAQNTGKGRWRSGAGGSR